MSQMGVRPAILIAKNFGSRYRFWPRNNNPHSFCCFWISIF